MFQGKTIEVAVGVFVAAGLGALFVLAMKVSNLAAFNDQAGYPLIARFDNIGGLKERAPVTMAGVRIGRVEKIGFDNGTYEAVVTLNINSQYNHVPKDTSASIFTSGLLGEQYIALEPGGDDKYMGANDSIKITQSALVLEQLIGQFLFKTAEGGSKDKGSAE
ncbi:MAG: outer membrane lipid asymmetry maintenance protein MlaD [Gammaproteobacteria bacterium]|nr:outer membrane lipid asymmetry maintenance protein MlaD [Gammaproteobacteria bacterium]